MTSWVCTRINKGWSAGHSRIITAGRSQIPLNESLNEIRQLNCKPKLLPDALGWKPGWDAPGGIAVGSAVS